LPLKAEPRLQGIAFDRRALQEFVASAWPFVEDDPDPARWAASSWTAATLP
jgi:hypothetical protein